MILYNITIKIQNAIHLEWLPWMQNHHIPLVLATGCFTDARMLRLLDIDDTEGPTYAIQYTAANRSLYDQYIEQFAGGMRQETIDKWGDQFIAFRSVMAVVK